MTGPNPSSNPPRRVKRRRVVAPPKPWPVVSGLFLIYLLAGLLLSAPKPPFWTWIIIAIAIPLFTIGLARPLVDASKTSNALTYTGGFLLAIAFSIALNYVGTSESFDNTRFLLAVLMVAVLILLAVGLCIAAAVLSTRAGERLLQTMSYKSTLGVLLATCFGGVCVGGLVGLFALTATVGI